MANDIDQNKQGQATSEGFSTSENFPGPSLVTRTPAPNQPKQTPPDALSEFTAGDYTWEQF